MTRNYPGWDKAFLPDAEKRPSEAKYGNQRTEYKGIVYDSKREALYAEELDWRARAGEVRDVKRQVKVYLYASTAVSKALPVVYQPSGRHAYHLVDYVFEEKYQRVIAISANEDGTTSPSTIEAWRTRYVEVKGTDTPLGKLKRAIVSAMLGQDIEVIK